MKKLIAIFSVMIMAFSVMAFAACGDTGDTVTPLPSPTPSYNIEVPEREPVVMSESAKLLRDALKGLTVGLESADVEFTGGVEIYGESREANDQVRKFARVAKADGRGSMSKDAENNRMDAKLHLSYLAARHEGIYTQNDTNYSSKNAETIAREGSYLEEGVDEDYYIKDGVGYVPNNRGGYNEYEFNFDYYHPYVVISDILCRDVAKYVEMVDEFLHVDLLNDDWTIRSLVDDILYAKCSDLVEAAYTIGLLNTRDYSRLKEIMSAEGSLLSDMSMMSALTLVDKLCAKFNAGVDGGIVGSTVDRVTDLLTDMLEKLFVYEVSESGGGKKLDISVNFDEAFKIADKIAAEFKTLLDNYANTDLDSYYIFNMTYGEFLKDFLDIDVIAILRSAKATVKGTMTLSDVTAMAEDALKSTGITRNTVISIYAAVSGYTVSEIEETINKYKDYSLNAFIRETTNDRYDFSTIFTAMEEEINDYLDYPFRDLNYLLNNLNYYYEYFVEYWQSEDSVWDDAYRKLLKNATAKLSVTFDSSNNLTGISGNVNGNVSVTGGTMTTVGEKPVYSGGIYLPDHGEFVWCPEGYISVAAEFKMTNFGNAAEIVLPPAIA